MKLSTSEDIEAPIEDVYAAVTDFDDFEKQLNARKIDVSRVGATPPVPGTTWHAQLDWRGRRYDLSAELISLDENQGYAVEAKAAGLLCMAVVDLMALADDKTRLLVSTDVRATSLSSRILLQSMMFAKGSLARRFRTRVADLASDIPQRP